MGGFFSALLGWFSGSSKVGILPEQLDSDADIPEPTSGLTPREVAYVKSTWALVKPDLRSHGVKLFLLLFETHPHLQKKFKPFAHVNLEDLIYNKKLAAHGSTVMAAIDSYIDNLDDVSVVIEMLKTNGHNHKDRNVTIKDFELLKPVFVVYLSEALGPELSDEAKAAWVHLMNVIVSVIGSSVND